MNYKCGVSAAKTPYFSQLISNNKLKIKFLFDTLVKLAQSSRLSAASQLMNSQISYAESQLISLLTNFSLETSGGFMANNLVWYWEMRPQCFAQTMWTLGIKTTVIHVYYVLNCPHRLLPSLDAFQLNIVDIIMDQSLTSHFFQKNQRELCFRNFESTQLTVIFLNSCFSICAFSGPVTPLKLTKVVNDILLTIDSN